MIVGLLAAIALAGGVWFVGDDWRINQIVVRNNSGVPVEAIKGASGLQGEHFQFVDLDAAAKAIDDLPGVEAAQITCRWEGRASCDIVIQPARPLAVWQSSRGNVWADYEGKVQQETEPLDARLILQVEEGDPPQIGGRLDERVLRALHELATVQPNVSRYLYSREYGLSYINEQGWRVRLGVAERDGVMDRKIRLARALREQLITREIKPSLLDVRFERAPYYIR
jgi:cell division septal protein FtsQ